MKKPVATCLGLTLVGLALSAPTNDPTSLLFAADLPGAGGPAA